MDFGQIVPLLLLVLPIFALCEVYFDCHKQLENESQASPFTDPARAMRHASPTGIQTPEITEPSSNFVPRAQSPPPVIVPVDWSTSTLSQVITNPSTNGAIVSTGQSSPPELRHVPDPPSQHQPQNQVASADAYQENLDTIKKLFYQEKTFIKRRESKARTPDDMTKLAIIKKKVVEDAQTLHKLEQQLSNSFSMYFFCYQKTLYIGIRILLNINNFSTAFIVLGVLLAIFGGYFHGTSLGGFFLKTFSLSAFNKKKKGEVYELKFLESFLERDNAA